VAKWDGGRLTVWDTNQGVFDIRGGLAQWLQLPLTSVRVISKYMGGGFGSKIEPGKYTMIAALLARKAGRPVRCFVSARSPSSAWAIAAEHAHPQGGGEEGRTLTSLQLTGLGTSGAYPDGSSAGYLVTDLYACPNVRTEETDVFINAGKARAFRAPGFPQGAWVLEQVMDELAVKLAMDPVELRLKNVPTVSQRRNNKPYTSTGLARCLKEGAEAFGWKAARTAPRAAGTRRARRGSRRRDVGLGGGGAVHRHHQVHRGRLRQPLHGRERHRHRHQDGHGHGGGGGAGRRPRPHPDRPRGHRHDAERGRLRGSQTTHVNSPAVRAAALEVKRQLLEMAAEQLKVGAASLSLKGGRDRGGGASGEEARAQGARAAPAAAGGGRGGPPPPHPKDKIGLPSSRTFAEVEVDTRTGRSASCASSAPTTAGAR